MKRLLSFLVFISLSSLAFSQNMTPVKTWGLDWPRGAFDSVAYLPTSCGVPSGIASLNSFGFAGQGQILRKAAIMFDSCGHKWYGFDPTDSLWIVIGSGGGGGSAGSADSIRKIPVDTTGMGTGGGYMYYDIASGKYKFRSLQVSAPIQGNGSSGSPFALINWGAAAPLRVYGYDASSILGFLTLGTAAFADKPVSGNASTTQVVMGNDSRLTDSRTPAGTNVVPNTMLAQMPANTIKGNNTGSTANAADLTVAQINALIGNDTSRATIGGLLANKQANFGGAPGQLQGTFAGLPAATGFATGTTYIAQDSGFQYVDTGSGGARGWKKMAGGTGSGGGGISDSGFAVLRAALVNTPIAKVLIGGARFIVWDTVASNPGAIVTQSSRQKLLDSIFAVINPALAGKQATITTNSLANSLMVQMGAKTIKGNNTSGTANQADLTTSQVGAMIGLPDTAAALRILQRSGTFDSLLMAQQNTFFSGDSILVVGHSIAFGTGASTADSSWTKRTTDYHSRGRANYAIVGSSITSVVNQNNLYSSLINRRATLEMGGLNTLRQAPGNMATAQRFIGGIGAIAANQFAANFVPASGGGVTRTGSSWTTIAGAGQDGFKSATVAVSNVSGEYVEYTFTDTAGVVVIGGCDSSGTVYNGSVCTASVDGVVTRTFRTSGQTDGSPDAVSPTIFPGHRSPMAIFFTGLSSGTHIIRITNTQNNYLYVDYFATLLPARSCSPVLFMHEPYMNATGWSGTTTAVRNTWLDTCNAKLDSFVLTISQYPARVGLTERFYTAAVGQISGDGIHPIDPGHRLIFQAAISATDSTHINGRIIYTNNALYLSTKSKSERWLTNKNFLPTNGLTANDSSFGLDSRVITFMPGSIPSGTNGYIGINNTTPAVPMSVAPTSASGGNAILEILTHTTNGWIQFKSGGTNYGYIGIGNGNYQNEPSNSIYLQAAGDVSFWPNAGNVNVQNGALNVGTSTAAASAIFNAVSTAKGFLFPRMTLAQFTAISSPATSLHAVLIDSSGRLALWNGTKIVTYATTDQLGSGGASAPFSDATAIAKNGSDPTKLLKISPVNITTATTRTLTAPDWDGIIATTNHSQTLTGTWDFTGATTNFSLITTSQVVSSGSSPTVTIGSAAPSTGGTTATASSGSNGMAGEIVITTGTGSGSGVTVVTIASTGSANPGNYRVFLQDTYTGAHINVRVNRITSTTWSIELQSGATCAASTTYSWNYFITN